MKGILHTMHFLVIRACAIGDFVLHLPALRALATTRPAARFTLVGYPSTLALARTFLPVDSIYSIESQPWAGLFAGPVDISGFDAAWVWMRDPTVATHLRESGVAEVFHADPFPRDSGRHAGEHLLRGIGVFPPELPDLWRPKEAAILHPGSGSPSKVWPRFKELAAMLPDARILLGPSDAPLDVSNPCLRDLSLSAVVEEIRRCRLFVGNDSGITHIAAYWGTPTVALFGPTEPAVWGPVGRRVQVVHKPTLADISVNDVRERL